MLPQFIFPTDLTLRFAFKGQPYVIEFFFKCMLHNKTALQKFCVQLLGCSSLRHSLVGKTYKVGYVIRERHLQEFTNIITKANGNIQSSCENSAQGWFHAGLHPRVPPKEARLYQDRQDNYPQVTQAGRN